MRKAQGVGTIETYPSSQYLCVLPPSSDSHRYDLPEDQRRLETCLHDSDNSLDYHITQNLSLRHFISDSKSRYFRLHPLLVESVQRIFLWIYKYYGVPIRVVKSYEIYSQLLDSRKLYAFGQACT